MGEAHGLGSLTGRAEAGSVTVRAQALWFGQAIVSLAERKSRRLGKLARAWLASVAD